MVKIMSIGEQLLEYYKNGINLDLTLDEIMKEIKKNTREFVYDVTGGDLTWDLGGDIYETMIEEAKDEYGDNFIVLNVDFDEFYNKYKKDIKEIIESVTSLDEINMMIGKIRALAEEYISEKIIEK